MNVVIECYPKGLNVRTFLLRMNPFLEVIALRGPLAPLNARFKSLN